MISVSKKSHFNFKALPLQLGMVLKFISLNRRDSLCGASAI